MNTKKLAYAITAALALGAPGAAFAAPPLTADFLTLNRGAIIGELLQSWQERINAEGLPVEDPKNWSIRTAAKFGRLTDGRLALAQRAITIDDLESLFIAAPIASGTSLGDLASSLPGDITILPRAPSGAKAGGDTRATPANAPDRYADLVFTAVTPCRIYDTRFRTQPLNGAVAGARWPANTEQTIVIGPLTTYVSYGGQATPCLGATGGVSGNPPSRIAALMGAVSTVNQLGAGYLVFWASGGTNPNPYGVAQWFQPNIVQTSFVVMPTDIVNPVFSSGIAGNFGTHVIIDVVGYFSKPKTDLLAVVNVDGTMARNFHAVSAQRLALNTGNYEVIFDRDVTACFYTATLGDGALGVYSGEVSATNRFGNVNGVFIQTYNSAGTGADKAFHLNVACRAE